MSDEAPRSLSEIQVDRTNLYREDVFTDLRVATLRRLTPILVDGSDDPERNVIFSAETQLMSQMGPVPVSAKIDAADLDEAITKFPQAIQDAVEQMMEEAREHQRREQSRIVMPAPGSIPPGSLSGGGGKGGKGSILLR